MQKINNSKYSQVLLDATIFPLCEPTVGNTVWEASPKITLCKTIATALKWETLEDTPKIILLNTVAIALKWKTLRAPQDTSPLCQKSRGATWTICIIVWSQLFDYIAVLHRIQMTEYRVQNYKMRAPGPLLYNMSNIVRIKCFILCHLIDSRALSQNLLHLLHRFCTYFSGPVVKCYSNLLYHNVQTSVSAALL